MKIQIERCETVKPGSLFGDEYVVVQLGDVRIFAEESGLAVDDKVIVTITIEKSKI